MTMPDERYKAVLNTKIFLHELCNPKVTPKVPKHVRETASWLLRHYPDTIEMKFVCENVPHLFAENMEPLYRMIKQYEQDKDNE